MGLPFSVFYKFFVVVVRGCLVVDIFLGEWKMLNQTNLIDEHEEK